MKIRSSTLGFTLTELILVIVLLSILSLFAASRFIGKSSFSAFALQEQVISVIRQVQVNRMQSNIDGTDDNFRLQVSSSCIGSLRACDLQLKCEIDKNETACNLLAARSDFVADDSAQFSIKGDVERPIDFNLLGNPLNSASRGASILIKSTNGGSRCEVDINSQGYVSKGSCS
ncbi:type II secretion system GspH family protein [Vibrio natriegens]|uniref:pilus assembly FimT family protein n=1 Tax=Vibrio natriegens TaxID=691 RepID=UPI0021E83194|nr:type II secretion system protein [Vibrio natriegens]UYI46793.1 type II secretion system GspH family protein [Vibrio natriegens]